MKRFSILVIVFILFLGTNVAFWKEGSGADKKDVPPLFGDVREGWKVFNKKNCVQCHSIWGEGGKEGPDLRTSFEIYVTQPRLAALMWNHWPAMWARISAKKIPLKKIDNKEMADLFAFLYFIGYMAEPGDPRKGEKVMEIKPCGNCHNVREGRKEDLSRWGTFFDPILWAQMMWNYAPQMEQEMKRKGLPSIKFKGNEMSDLVAYIRSFSPKVEKAYLFSIRYFDKSGDVDWGKTLFVKKQCIVCHNKEAKRLDLSRLKGQISPIFMAQTLWNHGSEMLERMRNKKIPWEKLA